MDIKHQPKLQTVNSEGRKRYLYVTIDLGSCFTADGVGSLAAG